MPPSGITAMHATRVPGVSVWRGIPRRYRGGEARLAGSLKPPDLDAADEPLLPPTARFLNRRLERRQ